MHSSSLAPPQHISLDISFVFGATEGDVADVVALAMIAVSGRYHVLRK
jgi:hypothetical protein